MNPVAPPMRTLALAAALAAAGILVLTAQESAPPPVFTAAQADAGRIAYQSTCGKCHTASLRGRTGDPGELPPVASLPANMRDVVEKAGGLVPPLAGPDFLAVWGARTTQELSARVKLAVGGFPPQGTDSQTYLNLTAYFLQAGGAHAGAQALTASTAVPIRSLLPPTAR